MISVQRIVVKKIALICQKNKFQFLLFSCLVYSQIFLILLVGDRQFGYITKLEKKKEHQWDGMIFYFFSNFLFFCVASLLASIPRRILALNGNTTHIKKKKFIIMHLFGLLNLANPIQNPLLF